MTASKHSDWRAGWEALDALPENERGEVVGGRVVLLPRPSGAHGETVFDMSTALGGPFRWGRGGPGGWVFVSEPDVLFVDEIRVPDLVGYRAHRYERPEKGPYLAVPDWLCEVLSPSNEQRDRVDKMELYARAGVQHVWLVDPLEFTLEVYRLEGRYYSLRQSAGGGAVVRAEPFEAVELELALFWGDRYKP